MLSQEHGEPVNVPATLRVIEIFEAYYFIFQKDYFIKNFRLKRIKRNKGIFIRRFSFAFLGSRLRFELGFDLGLVLESRFELELDLNGINKKLETNFR